MRSRGIVSAIAVGAVLWTSAVSALEFREEPYRVGIVDVGEPILLDYPELRNEMNKNNELRDWIDAYGPPDYAEFQRVELDDPFLPYEIRLYYIEGRRYVAFGRVTVSPWERNFGVRKYIGKLDSALLQRLLTAKPMVDNGDTIAAASVGAYDGSATISADELVVGEEIVVEEVIEMPSDEVVLVEAEPVEAEPVADAEAEAASEGEEASQ